MFLCINISPTITLSKQPWWLHSNFPLSQIFSCWLISERLASIPQPWVQKKSWLDAINSLETNGPGQVDLRGLLQ